MVCVIQLWPWQRWAAPNWADLISIYVTRGWSTIFVHQKRHLRYEQQADWTNVMCSGYEHSRFTSNLKTHFRYWTVIVCHFSMHCAGWSQLHLWPGELWELILLGDVMTWAGSDEFWWYSLMSLMDWFKGKSTGNHRFFHEIWIDMGLSWKTYETNPLNICILQLQVRYSDIQVMFRMHELSLCSLPIVSETICLVGQISICVWLYWYHQMANGRIIFCSIVHHCSIGLGKIMHKIPNMFYSKSHFFMFSKEKTPIFSRKITPFFALAGLLVPETPGGFGAAHGIHC